MSRTYRHRHMPRVEGCALKFIDAKTRARHRVIDERVESYWAHVLHDAPCIHGDPAATNLGRHESHWSCAHKAKLPSLPWRLERRLRSALGMDYPVSGVGSHPYMPWWAGRNSRKQFERTRGHRACRRKTKTLLQRFIGPEDPLWQKYGHTCFEEDGFFDFRVLETTRNLSARWYEMREPFPLEKYEIDPWSWD